LAANSSATAGYWIVVDPTVEGRQRGAIEDYCRINGISIPDELWFRDVWIQGKPKERQGFRRLLGRIEAGDVARVLIDTPDHWQVADWQDWLSICRGVRLVSAHEGELTVHDLHILKHVFSEREQLLKGHWMPPGHFYSPIPCIKEVRGREEEIFGRIPRELPGINLNEAGQWGLLQEFKTYYRELPFTAHKAEGLRYYYENGAYSYSDGIFLYCMLRHLRPRRIIEIGSGYSSCVILDTNQHCLANTAACTFIEPYAQRFLSLVSPQEAERLHLVQKTLQDIDVGMFEELSTNDVLFIDSTHVSKVGSDVNRLFFDILPRLRSGVFVHFHDIFYPFEYPKDWIYEGRAWNEDYLLRAFLQFNNAFEIQFFSSFLEHFHAAWFWKEMPLCMKMPGASIWLKRI
jgi:predicted O-methyltransferase YrrM